MPWEPGLAHLILISFFLRNTPMWCPTVDFDWFSLAPATPTVKQKEQGIERSGDRGGQGAGVGVGAGGS